MNRFFEQKKVMCPVLDDFLNKENYRTDNIYIVEAPVAMHYYVDKDNQYKSRAFKVEYIEVNECLRDYLSYCDMVYIYPYEDIENATGLYFSGGMTYETHIRLWINNDDAFVLREKRIKKLKRILDEDEECQ